MGVSKSTVHRILAQAKLQPHRLERYMASNDPAFEQKAADIIGLYVNPPQHAAVFCVERENGDSGAGPARSGAAIVAGARRTPRVRILPAWDAVALCGAEREDRSGGRQNGAPPHQQKEFVAFLAELVAKAKWAREIHIVLDNLSAHKTEAVDEFLAEHPKVRFHFTPTYSSWLNQVELWFAKIERDMIARGVFTSVSDLRREIMRYIHAYAKRARPIRWTYTDLKRRIVTKRITGTTH